MERAESSPDIRASTSRSPARSSSVPVSAIGILVVIASSFLGAPPLFGFYISPSAAELVLGADVILEGEIVALTSTTFTLRVDRVVAGEWHFPVAEILRFQDWTCSSRWFLAKTSVRNGSSWETTATVSPGMAAARRRAWAAASLAAQSPL